MGAETWVLASSVENILEGAHTGFLKQVTGNNARRQWDGSWRREGADSMLQAAGIQLFRMYIDRRQATVAEWVATWTILKFAQRRIRDIKVG